MSSITLTNLLIGIVITMLGYLGKRMIEKLDAFEHAVQDILISDIANKKDIEALKEDVRDHEERLVKLEN